MTPAAGIEAVPTFEDAGDAPRLYLITPFAPTMAMLPDMLAGLLDSFDIACVRMAASGGSEEDLSRTADTLRPVCHERDVPLLISDHYRLAIALGLDGVHLTDGARSVRAARKALAPDAIVGCHARASKHEGMNAAEIGADYVSFGPLTPSTLGDGTIADAELFAWWSELIETPVVAEGGLTPEIAADLARKTDFIALGEEIWTHPDGPELAIRAFLERLR